MPLSKGDVVSFGSSNIELAVYSGLLLRPSLGLFLGRLVIDGSAIFGCRVSHFALDVNRKGKYSLGDQQLSAASSLDLIHLVEFAIFTFRLL